MYNTCDADCKNNDGSYDCECKAGFVGNGIVCTTDICPSCDVTATCDSNNQVCNCPAGQIGSGIACENNQQQTVINKATIPLNRIPEIR